jgi:demethylmenaquinone methyltransferase/2-methoxy-6-polyprenyl-1,4-benzoquinol methylase
MASPDGDKADYTRLLLETDCLRDDLVRAIIAWLDLPSGSTGLDAGCGLGSNTLLLAEAVGEGGRVTGFDIADDFLRIAGERAQNTGLGDRIDLRQGNINDLPFGPETFDWAWSADCIGPGTGDPMAQTEALARVVRPGGSVIILAWSSQSLLPGYPMLEARLNATSAGIAPFKQDMQPEMHLFCGSRWLKEAGLQDVTTVSFVGDIKGPLDGAHRNALGLLFDMRWGEAQREVDERDWDLYKRLTDTASREFIGDRPHYYGFFTYTVFRGWRK